MFPLTSFFCALVLFSSFCEGGRVGSRQLTACQDCTRIRGYSYVVLRHNVDTATQAICVPNRSFHTFGCINAFYRVCEPERCDIDLVYTPNFLLDLSCGGERKSVLLRNATKALCGDSSVSIAMGRPQPPKDFILGSDSLISIHLSKPTTLVDCDTCIANRKIFLLANVTDRVHHFCKPRSELSSLKVWPEGWNRMVCPGQKCEALNLRWGLQDSMRECALSHNMQALLRHGNANADWMTAPWIGQK